MVLLEHRNDDESHSRRGQADGKRNLQPAHIRHQDPANLHQEDPSQVSRTSAYDSKQVKTWGRARENLD